MTFLEWLDDLDPWMVYFHDKLGELEQFDFKVEVVMPADIASEQRPYAFICYNENAHRIILNRWEDDFDELIARGLPFYVVDENHVGEPEVHGLWGTISMDDDTLETLSTFGIGYIIKNEKNLNSLTVSALSLSRALAILVSGSAPGDNFMGRGSATRANIEAVKNALEFAGDAIG